MATTITQVFGRSVGKYVLMAIIAGLIAGLSALLHLGAVVTEGAVVGAVIAGLSAALAQYSSTGSIPGTQIPIATLLQLMLGTALVVAERLAGATSWTAPTVLAALVLFFGTLLAEVQQYPSGASTGPLVAAIKCTACGKLSAAVEHFCQNCGNPTPPRTV